MSAICKYCKKRPSVIIPGNYLCSRCHIAGIGSPRMLRAPSARGRVVYGPMNVEDTGGMSMSSSNATTETAAQAHIALYEEIT